MKLDFKTFALMVFVAIASIWGTNQYNKIFNKPEPVKQDEQVGDATGTIKNTIEETAEVEIDNSTYVPDTLSWSNFTVHSPEYTVKGSVFGLQVRSVRITSVTTRTTITGTLWRTAEGGERITLSGGGGTEITPRSFEWGEKKNGLFDWFNPVVTVFSMVGENSAIMGCGLSWGNSRFSIDLGTNGNKLINYYGIRWKVTG